MRLAVGTEMRFVQGPDGIIRSQTGAGDYEFWTRYLAVFDHVTILGRVAMVPAIEGSPVTGQGVSVSAVTDYVGLTGFARRFPSSRSRVRQTCQPHGMAYLVRSPGLIGSLMTAAVSSIRRPYGMEVVGDPSEVLKSGIVPKALSPLSWPAGQLMRRQCARAAAIAYVTKEQLQARYPATRAIFATHYSSIELSPSAFAESPRTPTRTPAILLTVGDQSRAYKGHDVLIRATAHLASRGVEVRLRIVGDGPLNAELRSLAKELGAQDIVEFLGRRARGSEVEHELDHADLFVLPSRTEGLPRALIEAMARGLPCIASAVGGIPELLHRDDMVTPGDPLALASRIQAVLDDPLRRSRMAQRNLEAAREYSNVTLSKRRIEFYEALRSISEGN